MKTATARKPRNARPRLERLEDRLAPALHAGDLLISSYDAFLNGYKLLQVNPQTGSQTVLLQGAHVTYKAFGEDAEGDVLLERTTQFGLFKLHPGDSQPTPISLPESLISTVVPAPTLYPYVTQAPNGDFLFLCITGPDDRGRDLVRYTPTTGQYSVIWSSDPGPGLREYPLGPVVVSPSGDIYVTEQINTVPYTSPSDYLSFVLTRIDHATGEASVLTTGQALEQRVAALPNYTTQVSWYGNSSIDRYGTVLASVSVFYTDPVTGQQAFSSPYGGTGLDMLIVRLDPVTGAVQSVLSKLGGASITGQSYSDLHVGLDGSYVVTQYRRNGIRMKEIDVASVSPSGSTTTVFVDPDPTYVRADHVDTIVAADAPGDTPLKVQAENDDLGSATDNQFGTYLAGVKLPTKFTIAAAHPDLVAKVSFQVDSETAVVKPYDQTAGATVPFDPGTLKAGTHTLTVVGLDAEGNPVSQKYTGTIKAIDQLPFDLRANVPGQGDVPASDLRLVAGIAHAPALSFTATVANLPLAKLYGDKLAVTFVNHATDQGAIQKTLPLASGSSSFLLATKTFEDTLTGTPFDYDAYLSASASASYNANRPQRLSAASAKSPHVYVITPPKWLAGAAGTYVKNDAIAAVLGPGTGGYAFSFTYKPVDLPLPKTAHTPFKLFDGLESGLFAGFDVTLFARLTGKPGDAVFRTGKWQVQAKLLDQPVFQKTFDPETKNLKITGTVNPRTLDGLKSLTFSTKDPIDLFAVLGHKAKPIDLKFGDGANGTKPWKLKGLPVPLTGGLLTSSFYLDGTFRASFDTLTAAAALTFKVDGSGLSIDLKNTWLQIHAEAGSNLTMHAGLSVEPSLLSLAGISFSIFQAHVQGTANADLDATVRVNLAGSVVKTASTAGLTVGYDLKYAVKFLSGDKPDPASYEDLGKNEKTLGLFGLKAPSKPK